MNLVLGCLAIIEIFEGDLENVIYYTLLAGIADFLDGFSARLLKSESPIGRDLDSLADLVSFGVVPALLMLKLISGTTETSWLPYMALPIAAFSGLRLAKFNNDIRQSDTFYGLPTPANALFVNTLPFLSATDLFAKYIADPFVLGTVCVVSSVLLISDIRLLALKFKSYGWKDNYIKYLLVIICLASLATFKLIAIPFLIVLYLLVSIFVNIVERNKAKLT